MVRIYDSSVAPLVLFERPTEGFVDHCTTHTEESDFQHTS